MYGELLLNSAMNQVSALEILECGVSLSLVPCFERRLKSDGKSQLFSVSVFVASFVICEVKFQFCFTIVYHTGVGMRSVFVPIFFFAWLGHFPPSLTARFDCTSMYVPDTYTLCMFQYCIAVGSTMSLRFSRARNAERSE